MGEEEEKLSVGANTVVVSRREWREFLLIIYHLRRLLADNNWGFNQKGLKGPLPGGRAGGGVGKSPVALGFFV